MTDAAPISSPTKRAAEEDVPEVVEAKKTKAEPKAKAVETEVVEEENDEDVGGDLAHLDTANIIQGRRTRGKRVDYTKVEQPEEDEDEDDEDAPEPVEGAEEAPDSEDEEEEEDEE